MRASIIAIHGLDTSAPGTWEYREERDTKPVNWLCHKDMLPAACPEARIFTYNWHAGFSKDAVELTLRDHANGLLSDLRAMRLEVRCTPGCRRRDRR